MYLSCLLIDVGTNPDRPRPGRQWLRNIYRVHQRLCMAFPSAARVAEDGDFLKPFRPEDFAQTHVHVARKEEAGFLFRTDPQPGGRVVILVQSALPPDWDYAFHNAGFLLAAPPAVKPYDPCFALEETLRFRLRANPTKRQPGRHAINGENGQPKDGARQQIVGDDALLAWLGRKAEGAGFTLLDARVSAVERQVSRKGDGPPIMHQAVTFDGVLRVTDPVTLRLAIEGGIGSGKGFGFGLLSVARG